MLVLEIVSNRSLKDSFARVCLSHDLLSKVFLQRNIYIYIYLVGTDATAL